MIAFLSVCRSHHKTVTVTPLVFTQITHSQIQVFVWTLNGLEIFRCDKRIRQLHALPVAPCQSKCGLYDSHNCLLQGTNIFTAFQSSYPNDAGMFIFSFWLNQLCRKNGVIVILILIYLELSIFPQTKLFLFSDIMFYMISSTFCFWHD